MGEPDGPASSTETVVVSEAYAAARELLRRAEDDAARIRAEADRYYRQREQEAELVVAKARRVLAIAEEKAAGLTAAARAAAERGPAPDALAREEAADARPVSIDLTAPALADDPITPGSRRTRTELDSILSAAVNRAIDRALPADR